MLAAGAVVLGAPSCRFLKGPVSCAAAILASLFLLAPADARAWGDADWTGSCCDLSGGSSGSSLGSMSADGFALALGSVLLVTAPISAGLVSSGKARYLTFWSAYLASAGTGGLGALVGSAAAIPHRGADLAPLAVATSAAVLGAVAMWLVAPPAAAAPAPTRAHQGENEFRLGVDPLHRMVAVSGRF